MTANIYFKSAERFATVHNVTIIRYPDGNGLGDVRDMKDFVLNPAGKYIFVGDEIVSVDGAEILYVEFVNA